MKDERVQELEDRIAELETFVAGMSRRVVFARGEAMATTFWSAGVVDILSQDKRVEKFSMSTALVGADAALDEQRSASDPKTQAAIDPARLLRKAMRINLRDPRVVAVNGCSTEHG